MSQLTSACWQSAASSQTNRPLKEWEIRKRELKAGEITKDEYFEWKINLPETCDDCGKIDPHKK